MGEEVGVRGGAGQRPFLNGTSSFLPADMSDFRPFATVGSCVTPAGAPVQLTGPSRGGKERAGASLKQA